MAVNEGGGRQDAGRRGAVHGFHQMSCRPGKGRLCAADALARRLWRAAVPAGRVLGLLDPRQGACGDIVAQSGPSFVEAGVGRVQWLRRTMASAGSRAGPWPHYDNYDDYDGTFCMKGMRTRTADAA